MKSTIIVTSAIIGTIILYELVKLEESNKDRHKELMEKLNILVDGEKFVQRADKPADQHTESKK